MYLYSYTNISVCIIHNSITKKINYKFHEILNIPFYICNSIYVVIKFIISDIN